jgi:hypothetical protein
MYPLSLVNEMWPITQPLSLVACITSERERERATDYGEDAARSCTVVTLPTGNDKALKRLYSPSCVSVVVCLLPDVSQKRTAFMSRVRSMNCLITVKMKAVSFFETSGRN